MNRNLKDGRWGTVRESAFPMPSRGRPLPTGKFDLTPRRLWRSATSPPLMLGRFSPGSKVTWSPVPNDRPQRRSGKTCGLALLLRRLGKGCEA